MKIRTVYEIAYTLNGSRDFEEFRSKRSARIEADKLIKRGAQNVFLDTYRDVNGYRDLIDFEQLSPTQEACHA